MARIFDNIEQDPLQALKATLKVSKRADFCVGFLNLPGWQAIDEDVSPWTPAVGQTPRRARRPGAEALKLAASNACRDVERGLIA